jgi:type I restriction enzyme S subunit
MNRGSSSDTWIWRPIAEVCTHIIDCVNKTAPSVEGPTPFKMIRTTNVREGWVDTENVKYVAENVYEKWIRRGKPLPGDVILTREAPLGEVGLLRSAEHVFLGQRLVMYRANSFQLDNRFLLYSMLSHEVQAQFKSMGSGATVEHMRVPDCGKIVLLLPPLPIQQKIAAILSAYDDLIENNLRRIKILEEMAQNLYREWFVKLRFPGHEKVRMVDSPLGKIPEGWEATTIDSVTSYINRGVAPKYDDFSASLVINQKCIRDRKLSISLARRHRSRVTEEKYVRFGDVLINSTGVGTLGRIAQVYEKLKDVTVDTHVSIVRLAHADDIDYLGLALVDMEPHFASLGAGATGQTELRRDRIAETQIVMPAPELRMQFSDLVKPIRTLALSLGARNVTLRQTRDLLLPKLISGELDVSTLPIDTGQEAT